ncbi:hypothetical protein MLD38_017815 [Melastoma candidum]|uniref:Uncharacterized protein n=1 Tax=Melastoma candidum TaxID=119954 RepID=A0ACB9QTT3_9MYRT|nr:hypothetical protein MLD38_017815 [Melastoma candidum]
MERGGGSVAGSSCYYAVLGIRKDASSSEIRTAYRKLAMRWHPDKWTRDPHIAGEANRRFQQIQEAYSVLSDQSKRSMYDAGLYDPLEEEDEDFCDFMQEMISMMNNVKEDEGDSFEDLQRMFQEMVDGDGPNGMGFDFSTGSTTTTSGPRKTSAQRRTTSRDVARNRT